MKAHVHNWPEQECLCDGTPVADALPLELGGASCVVLVTARSLTGSAIDAKLADSFAGKRSGVCLAAAAVFLAMLAPVPAAATTPERVFATAAPSVVVVEGAGRLGSGVVVAPRLVATNCHVLGDAPEILVRQGRIRHAAQRAASDRERDLCLLEVPTLAAPAAPLGQAAGLRVGAPVYAIGAPAGLELSLSAGLVSQLRAAEGAPLVQTTAPISPGSSGGGLFDERARLVGITTFSLTAGQNLNFGLPAEWVAAAIAAHQVARTGWQRCRAAPEPTCLLTAALAIARGITDASSRAAALAAIAVAQAEAGDIAGALAIARGITDASSRGRALRAIAVAQAQAGDRHGATRSLAEALAAARGITDASTRGWTFQAIAAAQAQAGDRQGATQSLGEALALARGITDASTRGWTFRAITAAQAQAGDVAGALATVRGITDASTRGSALQAIAAAQAQAGDIAGALATARGITDASSRGWALRAVAVAQAQAGDLQGATRSLAEALATARGVTDASSRAEVLAVIGAAQAQSGDRQGATRSLAEALTIARGIPDPYSALRAIADAQMQADDRQGAARSLAEALTIARRITDWSVITLEGERFSPLEPPIGDIAAAQAQAGDIAGALATARGITDASSRGWALRAIAVAQAQGGDRQGATQSWSEALTTIEVIPPDDQRAIAFTHLAASLAVRR